MLNKRSPFLATIFLTLLAACTTHRHPLTGVKTLSRYPSASGIEYLDNRFYIIGDDASYLLVLDSNLSNVDSIPLYTYTSERIPKDVKPDLEAIAGLPGNRMLLTGSGSSLPFRYVAWVIDPATRKTDSLRMDTFYRRIIRSGVNELNIEGATSIPGGVLLSNRGSKGYPKNHLIFTDENFWEQQAEARINLVVAGPDNDSSSFSGISGLAYSRESDALLLTVSTEDTRNSMDDGAIGKSYLWIVRNISVKKDSKVMGPDRVIDLGALDERFRGQKIESVCIIRETSEWLYLLLAADNDNGSSSLFKLTVSKD